jgi:hypothetical protein
MLVFAIKMDETEIVNRPHWIWFHNHGEAWQWSLIFSIVSLLCAWGAIFGGAVRVLSKLALCTAFGLIAWALYWGAPHGIDMWVYGIFSVFSFWLAFDEGLNHSAGHRLSG